MHDVGTGFAEQAPQRGHVPQGQQRLAADVQGQMLGTTVQQGLQQAATGGHDNGPVSGGHQCSSNFQG